MPERRRREVLPEDAHHLRQPWWDGDALTARLVEGPAKGRLTLNPDGSFAYKPKRNFHGTDRFTYALSAGEGGTTTARVTIKVEARPN